MKQTHILFIDDELTIAEYVPEYLEMKGYKVTAFTDSAKALEWFRENSNNVDIVVTDHFMPKVTGLDLAKIAHKAKPEMPIFICSGNVHALEGAWKEAGIRKLFVKPYDLDALIISLKQAMPEEATGTNGTP